MTGSLSNLAIIISAMLGTFFGDSPKPRVSRDPTLQKLKVELLQHREDLRNGKGLPRRPTPQQLNDYIKNSLLTTYRCGLSSTQHCLKILRERNRPQDGDSIKLLQEREEYYKAQLENLERGSLYPVMPVVPRYPESKPVAPRQKD